MIEKLEITAYACAVNPFKNAPIQSENRSNADLAISVSNDVVTAKIVGQIVPATCDISLNDRVIGVIRKTTLPDPCDVDCGYLDGMPEEMIEIDWPIGSSVPVVTVWNPDHCQWYRSELVAVADPCGVDGCELLIIEVDAPGEIPIPNDKDIAHSGGGTTDWHILQNQIGPGMLFSLIGFFTNGLTINNFEMDNRWYCTCCFTGGKVTAVNGSYGELSITYDVLCMGVSVTGYPSDHIQWEVGDWVHLIPRPPNSNCQDSGRDFDVFQCACEIVTDYTIVPIKVGNFGD